MTNDRVSSEPERSDRPEPDQCLRTKISAWLSKQGYPLEMRVAAAFQRCGFAVQQGAYYEDEEGDREVRELDVRAWTEFHLPYSRDGRVEVVILEFAIQCKSAPAPWVAFLPVEIARRDFLEYPAVVTPQSDDFRSASSMCSGQGVHEALRRSCPYAYALTTAILKSTDNGQSRPEKGKDSAYEGLITAAKASWGLVRQRRAIGVLQLSVPMIVTSGKLFTAKLHGGDEVLVEEAQECMVGFEYPLLDARGFPTFVHVSTSAELDRVASSCWEAARAIRATLEENASRILAELDAQRHMRG